MTTSAKPLPTATNSSPKRGLFIAGGLLLAAVAVALIIALASGGSDTASTEESSARIPQGAVRQVSFAELVGDPLPPFESAAGDSAIGLTAPAITASYFDNSEITITPGDGTPRVLLFLAHWCPHCQAEVGELTDWFGVNGVPSDVEIVAISTSVDAGAPNYPPATWLLREGWPIPVLRDSAQSELATGYGLTSYPFLVAIDGDGAVVNRSSGQLPAGQWDRILDGLRSAPTAG